jgi:hypothetical protein
MDQSIKSLSEWPNIGSKNNRWQIMRAKVGVGASSLASEKSEPGEGLNTRNRRPLSKKSRIQSFVA